MVQVNHPNPPEFNHSFCMLIKFACFLPSADFFLFFFSNKINLTNLIMIRPDKTLGWTLSWSKLFSD